MESFVTVNVSPVILLENELEFAKKLAEENGKSVSDYLSVICYSALRTRQINENSRRSKIK